MTVTFTRSNKLTEKEIEFLKNEQQKNEFLKFKLENIISVDGTVNGVQACHCLLIPLDNPRDFDLDSGYYLRNVSTKKEYIGKGLGTKMIEFIVGDKNIFLSVKIDNNKAIELYEKFFNDDLTPLM